MKPPKREFEKVAVDQWLPGEISELIYDEKHEFKTREGLKVLPAVKFVLSLDGYKEKKHTRWFTFNYSENGNLYKTFLLPLVHGAHKNMDFDLDILKNMRINVMYVQNGEYQNIAMVRPQQEKVLGVKVPMPPTPADDDDEKVPF